MILSIMKILPNLKEPAPSIPKPEMSKLKLLSIEKRTILSLILPVLMKVQRKI